MISAARKGRKSPCPVWSMCYGWSRRACEGFRLDSATLSAGCRSIFGSTAESACICNRPCYNAHNPDLAYVSARASSVHSMTFRNQVILITGGSSGIGLATARAFAREGAHVWLVARNVAHLEKTLGEVKLECQYEDQKCGLVPADVAAPDYAAAAAAEVSARAGLPDIVANSHGISHPGYFQELDLAVFHELMDANYYGALHVIKAVSKSNRTTFAFLSFTRRTRTPRDLPGKRHTVRRKPRTSTGRLSSPRISSRRRSFWAFAATIIRSFLAWRCLPPPVLRLYSATGSSRFSTS